MSSPFPALNPCFEMRSPPRRRERTAACGERAKCLIPGNRADDLHVIPRVRGFRGLLHLRQIHVVDEAAVKVKPRPRRIEIVDRQLSHLRHDRGRGVGAGCGDRAEIMARRRIDAGMIHRRHCLVALKEALCPIAARLVAAESLLLKHQLLISNRSRRCAPNLTMLDRLVLWLIFMSPHRIPKLSAISSRLRYSSSTRRWSIENTVCCSPLHAGDESLARKALPRNSSRPSSR